MYRRDDLLRQDLLHTEIEVADQTYYLTQSLYTDTGATSTSADPCTSNASHAERETRHYMGHFGTHKNIHKMAYIKLDRFI